MLDASKKQITLLVLLFLVVIPLVAYGVAYFQRSLTTPEPTLNPPQRTEAELSSAISRYNDSNESTENRKVTGSIDSFERMDSIWYVVDMKDGENPYHILVGDFYEDANRLTVLYGKGESPVQGNISGYGVPYNVLESLKNTNEKTHSHE